MSAIKFRGAFIRFADVRFSDNSEPFVRLHMSADWTDLLRDAMEWEDIPVCAKGKVGLKADISPHNFTLVPADKLMYDHRLDVPVASIGDFALVTTQGEQEGTTVRRVNYTVNAQVNEIAAIAILNYMHRMGPGPGLMVVQYAKQMTLGEGAEQESSDAPDEADDEADSTEEAGETFDDPRTTTNISHRRGRRSAGGTA